MRIVYQGDIHLCDKKPANRIDDYTVTQFRKLQWLVDQANIENAHLLLGGDIFDHYRVSAEVVNEAIRILNGVEQDVFTCLGQHDVPYHQTELPKSPVYSLAAGGAITHCPPTEMVFLEEENVAVHLISWQEAPPEPLENVFNIFLAHVSVFEKEIPFYWKGEAYTHKSLQKKYPGFDLYLCGDIHVPCIKPPVIVSGPMLRNSINLIDYAPRCYFIDTKKAIIAPRYYEIERDVFAAPEIKQGQQLDLDPLLRAMRSSAGLKNSYKKDCYALATEDKTKKVIEEIFDELD